MFDIGLAASGLLVSAPLWAAIAVVIVLDDGAPVFFRQARWGRGGRRFMALKFRTMHCDAASEQALQATTHDPRVTWVGRWLRASALDELPQLWNILQGDMRLWQLPWRTTDGTKTLLMPGSPPMQREVLWPAFTPTTMFLCGLRCCFARLVTRLSPHVT